MGLIGTRRKSCDQLTTRILIISSGDISSDRTALIVLLNDASLRMDGVELLFRETSADEAIRTQAWKRETHRRIHVARETRGARTLAFT